MTSLWWHTVLSLQVKVRVSISKPEGISIMLISDMKLILSPVIVDINGKENECENETSVVAHLNLIVD